jgi:hypothetical protein
VNGRFTYTAGRRNFVFDETAVTAGPGGAQTTTTVFNQGNAQRPVATGNLNIAFRPSSKLYLINSTACIQRPHAWRFSVHSIQSGASP